LDAANEFGADGLVVGEEVARGFVVGGGTGEAETTKGLSDWDPGEQQVGEPMGEQSVLAGRGE
jgi:hypothetical protein